MFHYFVIFYSLLVYYVKQASKATVGTARLSKLVTSMVKETI